MRAGQRLRTGQIRAPPWRVPLQARCPHWVEQALLRTKDRLPPRWELTADWVPQQVLRRLVTSREVLPGSAGHVALHLYNHSTERFEPILFCTCAYPPLRGTRAMYLMLVPPPCTLPRRDAARLPS